MATAGGSYQIHIRVAAHRAARRLKGLQRQLTEIETQVKGMPLGVMDGGENITADGTKRIKSRGTALRAYGTATASAAKGVRSLNRASAGLGENLAAINANTPGAVKARQMKEYAASMRSLGTASARASTGTKEFRAASAGLDRRIGSLAKSLPEVAVGMELLDSAMRGTLKGWGIVNTNVQKATPAMSAYAKATNAAAAAQERMNRASLGATKRQAVQDKPAAAATQTGSAIRKSTAVQSDAATAATALTSSVRTNYEELTRSARALAASTGSLTAFGHNARSASSGVEVLAKSNNRLAASIAAIATAQKNLNTAYAGATGRARQQEAARTQRTANRVRAATTTQTPATVTTDVDAMYRNLEGVSNVASTAEPRIARLATSMDRYATAARLAANSTRNLARHLGTVSSLAPRAAGAMNVATDSAAKASLAAAGGAAAGAGGTAASGIGATATASREATTEIDKADKAMRGWSNSARTHGATMNWAGRQISMFFTLPLALAMGGAVKWQMDFEKAMAQVVKVYDGDVSHLKNSAESIENGGPHYHGSDFDRFFTALSSVMGKSRAEIAEIAGDWAAVGMSGEQLASATQLTTEMMILGDMEAAEATRALIAVQAQYGLSLGNLNQELEALDAVENGVATAQQKRIVETESLADVMATLNAVENATGARMPDLIRGFERTGAPARQLGIDVQTLAAHMATLVPAMGTAERAGNGLKTIYERLGAPRTERQINALQNLATHAGLAADAFTSSEFLAEGLGKGIEDIAQAYAQLQGADRFEWARDVFGVYQYARAVQLFEDVSRGLGYQTDEQAEYMRSLGEEFNNLSSGAEEAAFIAEHFGIALGDMSDEAVQARQDIAGLLREADKVESLSYYQKAGGSGDDALSSREQLELYQRELNTVLESNPHQFQVAMRVIQNAMMDFIVPILPLIVGLAQQAAKLAQWLGNLPPEVQKLIAMIVLTIAAFGPLIALFGTFFIATAMMSKAFKTLTGFLGGFRKEGSGALRIVDRLSKAVSRIRRGPGGGGGLFGGGGGGGPRGPSPVPLIGGGSAWPRDPKIQAGVTAVDKLGDEARDMAGKAGAAAGSLDAFTASVMRNLNATRGAVGAGAGAAAAGAGGAAGGRKGKGSSGAAEGAGAAAAGGLLGGMGIPGLGRRGRKKAVDDAKKTQAAVGQVERKGMLARLGAMFKFNKDATAASAKGGRGIVGTLGRILGGLPKLFTGPFKLIARLLPRLLGVAFGPIGWAITGVIFVLEMFGVDVMGMIGNLFKSIGSLVSSSMSDDGVPLLARPFVAGLEVAKKALVALPKAVANSISSVINMLGKMAERVAQFFSSLNPFQRHSPSLVDNVTRGMAIIDAQFAGTGTRIRGVMQSALADVKAFGAATAGLSMNVENIRIAENREKIATHAPEAVPTFDALVSHQRELVAAIDKVAPAIKAQEAAVDAAQRAVDGYDKTIERMSRSVELAERHLEGLNDRLSDAQENFDRFANAQIAGLGAVDDAIFENEMAQKRLQLALKRAGADDMQTTEDALARIQGQMDDMAAKREDLRLGGAGSEILSVYDQQLGALAGQRESKMTGPSTEIERMNKALEDLQEQAEIMDLERSLKFDPLNRQLDELKNKTEEMSFEQISAGLVTHGAQVDLYQGQVDRATEAIERQRDAITAVEDRRYQAGLALDAEQEKLDALNAAQAEMQEVLDEVSAAIDTAIADAEAYTSHLEEMERKANEAADAVGGLGDELDAFGDAADFDIPGGSFNPDEMLPSLDEMTDSLTDKLKEWFDGINIGEMFSGFGGKLKDGIWNLITSAIPSVSYLTGYLIGFVGRVIYSLWEALVSIWHSIVDFFSLFSEIDWEAIKDNVTSAEWWQGVGQALWDGLGNGLKAAWEASKNWVQDNIFTPFMDGLKKGFGIASPAATMLPVGGDIAAGLIEGIRQKIEGAAEWFASLPGMISGFIGNLWGTGWAKAQELWQGIQDKWPEVVEGVRNFGADIWQKLRDGIGDLWETAKGWAEDFLSGVGEKWDEVVNFARDFGSDIYNKIKEGLGDLWQLGVDTAKGFLEGLGSWVSNAYNGAKEWAEEAVQGMKDGAETHSPSRATMRIGQDVAAGYVLGLESSMGDVVRASQDVAAAAIPAAAPMAREAQQAAPAAAPAVTGAPASAEGESPFQALATDAQAGLGQVQTVVQNAATTTSAGYLATMGQMRLADLTSQTNHLLLTTQNAANMNLNTVASATAMATGVTTQAATMAANATSQAATMATGVTSAGASMATGVLNAGASMEAGMSASMARMSSNVAGVVNGQIAPVIGSIDPMLHTMTGWFDAAVNNTGTIWAGIQPRTADPARFVINEVYNNGLRNAWNAFNEFLGIGALPERVAHFSTGGPVKGPGGDTSDKIPAMLSNNEYVIRAAAVKKIGVPTLNALNSGAFSIAPNTIRSRSDVNEMLSDKTIQNISARFDNKVPKFAAGGVVKGDPIWQRFKRAHDFGLRWHGAPYVWGGSLGRDAGTDCSGWQSSVADVIHGGSGLVRQWATGSFPGGGGVQGARGPQGFVAGLGGGMSVGVSTIHTAGTISGVPGLPNINLESGGAHNYTAFGPPSVGADHGQFPSRYHLDISGLGKFISAGGGGGSMDWGSYVSETFDAAFADIVDPGFPGIVGQWVPKSIEKARTAEPFLLRKLEEMVAYMGTIDDAAGAVERWRPMMKAALIRQGLADWANDPAILDRFMRQIQTESTGDPGAVQQIVDINGTGESAGVGLGQAIPSTWAAYRDPTLPDNRRDPWAMTNFMARYVRQKYGPTGYLNIGNGIGYDRGGILPPTPGGYGTYYNHTGKPEMVLTNAQWRAIYRAATLGPSHLAGVAAEAAAAAVEQVTAMDSDWKAAILGEAEAISEAVSEPPADPWEAFNSTLNTINDVAQKAGTIGQAILAAQEDTAAALAAADERILEAANAAAEAVSEDENKIVAETERVKNEVAKVATDTEAIADTVAGVAEDVEKVADNSESPELFTEAIERLWGEANDLYAAAIAEATGHIDRAINTGDLEGGLAALREQEARHGAEANRIAAETLTLLSNNLDTVAAVVGAWKPVVDGIYELAKAIPDAEVRRNDPWLRYPGGPVTFMDKVDGALTGIWNVGAELFNLTKNVLPALVKHSVGIGSGILNFVAENADAVAAIGVALATGNVAAVLPFIPKILAAALELLPMIIQAIQEIVPALIKGIMNFFQSIFDFGGRTFSYDSMEDARRAVQENTEAIRKGTFVAGREPESGTLERDQGGSMVVFNGDLSFPNVTNENDAKGFLSGVQSLSGRA